MGRYNKGNITLQIRVPVEMATSILGRIYGKGLINREQYLARLQIIDRERAEIEKQKNKKMEIILKNVHNFYNKNS